MTTEYRVVYEQGPYRILELPYTDFDIEDLKGDAYNPKCHPDMDPKTIAQEERDFEDSVNREGVFGYVLELWNPELGKGWTHVDSCFGFVGQYTPGEEIFNHDIVEEMKRQIPTTEA